MKNQNIEIQSLKDIEVEFVRRIDIWSKKDGRSIASIEVPKYLRFPYETDIGS